MRHMGLGSFDLDQYPITGRDVCEAYRVITGIDMPPSLWWEHFKREWWASIPVTDECYELIDLSGNLVGNDNVALLTSPTKCGQCLAGKLDWVQDKLPSWLHRQYIITPRKWFCATPETLLIDDCQINTHCFESAGGKAILYPQPWNLNREHTKGRFLFITKELEEVKND